MVFCGATNQLKAHAGVSESCTTHAIPSEKHDRPNHHKNWHREIAWRSCPIKIGVRLWVQKGRRHCCLRVASLFFQEAHKSRPAKFVEHGTPRDDNPFKVVIVQHCPWQGQPQDDIGSIGRIPWVWSWKGEEKAMDYFLSKHMTVHDILSLKETLADENQLTHQRRSLRKEMNDERHAHLKARGKGGKGCSVKTRALHLDEAREEAAMCRRELCIRIEAIANSMA